MPCVGVPAWLDCSDAAQIERKRRLDELMAKSYSGISSIADRGRSVSYRDPASMEPLIRQLQDELIACATGVYPRGRHRLAYIDQIKGL